MLESVTDSDWGGCRRTRRSKSSAHFYLGGSLIASHVRAQKSVALSSGEAEFIAMVGGAAEMVFLKDCLDFILKGMIIIEAKVRSDSSAAQGMAQRIGTGRVRHLACGVMWLQASVKEKILKVGPISGSKNPADLGTKVLSGPKVRQLMFYAGARLEDNTAYGKDEAEEAEHKAMINRIVTSGVKKPAFKNVLPVLLVLSQIVSSEGAGFEDLGLSVAMASLEDAMFEASYMASAVLIKAVILMAIPLGIMALIWQMWKRALAKLESEVKVKTCEVAVQARINSREEQSWADEYTERVNYLNELLSEERRKIDVMERALREAREELRGMRAQGSQMPARLSIAVSRGTVYHRPSCHCLSSRGNVKSFAPCQYCFPRATG